MDLELRGIGKRFGREWVLRDIDLSLPRGSHTAILGANGSGKSTLLKIIAGFLSPTKGTLEHSPIPEEKFYKEVSIVAPYLDLYQDLDLDECINLHFSLRNYKQGMSKEALKALITLPEGKAITSFSSGMVQRLKIGLALATESSLLLLDEATMNLDKPSMDWYAESLSVHAGDRTVVVASNTEGKETQSCTRQFRISEKRLEQA